MTLCTNDGQTTGSLHLVGEFDIGTTASHIGGDGDGTQSVGALSGVGHDISLLLVELGVEHLVWDMSEVEHT